MSVGKIIDLGEGLAIRQMSPSDASSISHHADDRDIACQMRDGFPSPYSERRASSFISTTIDTANWRRACSRIIDAQEPTRTADDETLMPTDYAIALHNETIGAIGMRFRSDVERRTAEIGYWCKSHERRLSLLELDSTPLLVCQFPSHTFIRAPR